VKGAVTGKETLESGSQRRRSWSVALPWILAVVVAVLCIRAITTDRAALPNRPAGTDVSTAHPARSLAPRCEGASCAGSPQPGQRLIAAFANHIPGSVVLFEHTASQQVGGAVFVQRRLVRAVTGNVVMTLAITKAGVASHRLRSARRVRRRGYDFDFRFHGFYPPPTRRLRALADDPRLTSLDS